MLVTIHKKMLEQVCPANWASLNVWAGLLNKEADWLPAVGDESPTVITTGLDELAVTAYERIEVTGLGYNWNSTEERYQLTSDTIIFPALESGVVAEAVSGVFLIHKVTTDADSWLLQSWILDEVVDLTGGDVTVSFGASGLAVVSQQGLGS